MTKRLFSLMTTLIMMISFTVPTLSVFADNDLSSAVNYTLGTNVSDIITDQQNKLLYKFDINSSGRIQIDAIAQISCVTYRIYDYVGNEVWCQWWIESNGTTGQSLISDSVDLLKGTYYFCVEQCDGGTGIFNFILSFTSANESFVETENGTNNSLSTANNITLNTNYNGQIAKNDSVDFYKFTINSSGRLYINAIAKIYRITYRIYNSVGDEVWCKWWIGANGTTNQSIISDSVDLLKGTYYFCVEQCDGGTGNYTFSISDKKPSLPKAAASNTSIKRSSNGKSSTASKKPVKVNRVAVKKSLKRTVKISWAKVSGAKGYQVKWATNKNFKKAKYKFTSKRKITLKKLKKKKYFVKVRAYKTINGNTYYGKWSKTVKVKVK